MSFTSPFTGQVIQPTDVSYRSITLAADETLSWPINGSDTDNAAARVMDVTSLSSGAVLTGVTVTGTNGQCSCTTPPSLFVVASNDVNKGVTGNEADSRALFESFAALKAFVAEGYTEVEQVHSYTIYRKKP